MTVSKTQMVLTVLSWPVKFAIRILGMVSGLLVVPVGLAFEQVKEGTRRPFTDYPEAGYWEHVGLPDKLWMWSNDEDGALGDTRGWWAVNTQFGDYRGFFSKFWWMAIRNPFNNASRFSSFYACHIANCDFTWYGKEYVRDDVNGLGWQLVFSKNRKSGKIHGGFYWVYRWGNSDRALVVQIGNKIYPRHQSAVESDPLDYYKGFTFEVQPFKNIA